MKVVILAGGLGTRISEYTKFIPKPMIKVLGKPILHRIMDHFALYGHKEFFIATGYKSKIIRDYFKSIKVDKKYKIHLINTGKSKMTGGRLKRLKHYLNETFLMTYGDGLSSVDINKLIKYFSEKTVYFKSNNKYDSSITSAPNRGRIVIPRTKKYFSFIFKYRFHNIIIK